MAERTTVVAARVMRSRWIWETHCDTELTGLPEGLDLDAKERMMIAGDLQGSGLSIRKDFGAKVPGSGLRKALAGAG